MKSIFLILTLSLITAAAAHADTVGDRQLVMTLRTEQSGTGFVDLASVRDVDGRKEADLLVVNRLISPDHTSHIIAHVEFDCAKNSAQFLSGQGFDVEDRLLERVEGEGQAMGQIDVVTFALICGGPGAPANPRVFPNAAAAAAWARTGGT